MNENDIGNIIVNSAVTLHRELGPGLLESVYEVILAHELEEAGLTVDRQVTSPIEYRGTSFSDGFRADIIAERKVIIELKSVENVNRAQRNSC